MRRLVGALFGVWLALAGGRAFAQESATPGPPPQHHGSAFVDPFGLLLFGPRIGVEAGGDHLSGAIYARWFDAGLLSRSLFLRDGARFAFSWGAGLRGRYYLAEGQAGFHLGAGAEYLRTRIETPTARIASISGYTVPYAEAGYRLPLTRFFAGAAAALGYAARLSGNVENLPGGNTASTYEATDKSAVYATANIELGMYF